MILNGDLTQMNKQANFLKDRGFLITYSNVYPIIKEEDVENALQLIWNNNVPGWHHYEKQYVMLGICTKNEFWKKLNEIVDKQE